VREYLAAVRTKSFVISVLVLPLMMGGSILAQMLLKGHVDTTEKRFAVVDRTPGQKLWEVLQTEAAKRNREDNKQGIFDTTTGKQIKPAYTIEHVEPSANNPQAINQQRYELSERVRTENIVGFLEIAPKVLEYSPAGASPETSSDEVAIIAPSIPETALSHVIRY